MPSASRRSSAPAVADLVLGAGQDGRTIQPEGIRASALTPPQQTMLLDIVREWAGIQTRRVRRSRGWPRFGRTSPTRSSPGAVPTTNGSAAYFRIQGPTLHIEYAPQRDVTHIHTIYRDPTNDYGAKFTKK